MKALILILLSAVAHADDAGIVDVEQLAGDRVCEATELLVETSEKIASEKRLEKLSGTRNVERRRLLAEQFMERAKDVNDALKDPNAKWLKETDCVNVTDKQRAELEIILKELK